MAAKERKANLAGILEGVETKGGTLILHLLSRQPKEAVHTQVIATLDSSDVAELRKALNRIEEWLERRNCTEPTGRNRPETQSGADHDPDHRI
jgi:hypothetical protein